MDELRSFRRFRDREEADELSARLTRDGLHALVRENNALADALFIGETTGDYHVMLPASEFHRAEMLLEKDADEELAHTTTSDHYLNGFTDDELIELLWKQDEWSIFDRQLAKKILGERGIALPDRAVDALRTVRNKDLQAPAPEQTPFVVVGYVLALFGGMLGIAIGWYLNMSKKTLPDGQRVPVYNAKDRRHGLYIFFLGLAVVFSVAVFRIVAALREA